MITEIRRNEREEFVAGQDTNSKRSTHGGTTIVHRAREGTVAAILIPEISRKINK